MVRTLDQPKCAPAPNVANRRRETPTDATMLAARLVGGTAEVDVLVPNLESARHWMPGREPDIDGPSPR